jgi:hypothetical protein
MLSSDEMDAIKTHVAACSRCQEILAQLEATDEVVTETEQESIIAGRASVLSTGALYRDYVSGQPSTAWPVAAPASKPKVHTDISSARGRKVWRWAAPAGAIAAGLLIWVVARDQKFSISAPVQNIQVAQDQAANSRLADQRNAQATVTDKNTEGLDQLQEELSREKQPVGHRAAENAGDNAGSLAQRPKSDSVANSLRGDGERDELRQATPPARNVAPQAATRAAAAPAPSVGAAAQSSASKDNSPADLPIMARNGTALQAGKPIANPRSGETLEDNGRNTLKKQKLEPGLAGELTASSSPNEAAPKAQPGAPVGEAAKTEAKKSVDAAENKEANAKGALVSTAQAEVTANYERMSSAQSVSVDDAKTIVSPSGAVLWRLHGVKIEHSSDGATKWERQNSGVHSELLGGSAPSDAVCWIVGRKGTILRTTDGGGHWSKVVSPVSGDVVGIRAVDANHATILDGNGQASFSTNDGGMTWTSLK